MFEWNHNTHYHSMILKELPSVNDSALDIGSGLGLFSYKLSSVFTEVVGLDPDKASIDFSRMKYAAQNNIEYINASFTEYDFSNKQFDFISSIASMHHMNFEKALEKMKMLLKPGGRIFILGLYKESTVSDLLISSAAVIPNYFLTIKSISSKNEECGMITSPPYMTIKEIRTVSDRILKKYRFRRHLFWRYSMVYENQGGTESCIMHDTIY